MDTYVAAIIEAIAAMREICKVEKINTAAACVGALTLTALLGYYAAAGDESPVNSATQLVAVLDIGTDSMIGMFVTKDIIKAAKAASGLRGVLEGSDMGRIFAWLRPNDLVWNYWVNNYLMGNDHRPSTCCTGTATRRDCPPDSTPMCWTCTQTARFSNLEKRWSWGDRSTSGRFRSIPTSAPVSPITLRNGSMST